MNAYYYLNLVERGIITASEVYEALKYFRIRESIEITQALEENQAEYEPNYELDDIAAYKHSVEY